MGWGKREIGQEGRDEERKREKGREEGRERGLGRDWLNSRIPTLGK